MFDIHEISINFVNIRFFYPQFSARTVAGHEAARLGSQLAASQRQRREREAAGICEPRARSYDHQQQEKPEKCKYAKLLFSIKFFSKFCFFQN